MFELSAFSDEYSPEFDKQLEGLKKHKIPFMEIRGVDGKNIADLTLDEAIQVKNKLDKNNIKISSIGSPIGKIGINQDFEIHLNLLRHVIKIAKILGTNRIRMFSFYIPHGENPEQYRGQVMYRLGKMLEIAKAENIILCHENEKGIYGENAERCLDIIERFNNDIKCIFDHANFISCDVEPYPYAYNILKDYIYYMHIKDATAEKQIVPAGDGIGCIPKTLSLLKLYDKDFILTVEPHLTVFKGLEKLEVDQDSSKIVNQYSSSEEAFAAAVNGIKRYL